MSTATVQLDDEDEALLKQLASEYGGRSNAIRHALRSLAADRKRQSALPSFLAAWDDEEGPINDQDVAAMVKRFGL
jgi:Arc/MetJ-type ribon-helix-helix transcriptional regulator